MEKLIRFDGGEGGFDVLIDKLSESISCVKLVRKYSLTFSILKILSDVEEILKPLGEYRFYPSDYYSRRIYFEIKKDNSLVGVLSLHWESNADLIQSKEDFFTFQLVSNKEICLDVSKKLDELYSTYKRTEITWWWQRHGKDDAQKSTLTLSKSEIIYKEFYPWLKKYPIDYMQDYLNSSASLLMVFGPPGTGKTSFIRYFLNHFSQDAIVSWETDFLSSDELFVDFLNGLSNVLVIEDADVLLHSRESKSNESMSRFLNVSDGLIKFPNKKIIFTSNLERNQIGTLDPALLRAGRCFDVQSFRELTESEAKSAASIAGLNTDFTGPRTLAQLFNPEFVHKIKRSVGF